MSPVDMFDAVTEKGSYIVSYITDGWTKEIMISASNPSEAMIIVQNKLGSICNVTYIERGI